MAALLGLTMGACSSPIVQTPTSVEELEFFQPSGAKPYLVQAGDELEVRFFHTPEFNIDLPVRPDGRISLPLAKEILVAGRSVEDITEEITNRYALELNEPEVAVIVRSFTAYQVHVGGEVDDPGVVQLTGNMRLLDALFQAGGILDTARLEEVILIRRAWGEKPLVIPVNVSKIFDNTDSSQNVALVPYDAIFVPKSGIADVNVWVDQYIRQNIPVNFSIRPEFIR